MDARFQELADTGRLPSPSGIGARILSLTQDPDVTIDDISSAITHDPALTGRLLRVANSAATAGALPLATAQEATMRLGLKSVSSIAVGFTLVANNRSGACADFDYPAYWSRSMGIAVAAQALCRTCAPEMAAEAFTAGLMLEIGQMAFASAEPEIYGGIQRLLLRGVGSLQDMEQRNFGHDHFVMGSWLLGQWGMPELFATAIKAAGQGRLDELEVITMDPAIAKLAQSLSCAKYLAHHHIGKPEATWAEDAQLAELLGDLGIDTLSFGAMFPAMEIAWRDLAADLAFKPLPPLELEEHEIDQAAVEATGALVLAVDPNAVARKIATNCLHRAGIQIATAATSSEAIGIALEHQPAVLIVDWQPVAERNLDGDCDDEDTSLALCQALRRCEAGRNLFVIALCKHEHEEACMAAFDAEADDFLTKPFAPKDLVARVGMGLRLSSVQDQVANRRSDDSEAADDAGAGTCDIDDIIEGDTALGESSGRCSTTGLPNRVFATSRLENYLASPTDAISVVGVVVDGFDHFAPDQREAVNRELGGYLGETLRKRDIVVCSSPGQFLLLCPGTDMAGAQLLGERLLTGAPEHLASPGGANVCVTLSICIAEREQATTSAEALIARVENSLAMSEADGSNRVFNAA